MTKDQDPKKVLEEMAKKNADQSEKKLTFDPTTGELIIKNPEDASHKPNEIVVDQIYKDGFFNSPPERRGKGWYFKNFTSRA